MSFKNRRKFEKFKINEIEPLGWIKEFLERQVTGLTGNIEVAGYPYNTKMWATNEIFPPEEMKQDEEWSTWWPFEQTSYFLDGANRVGHLLKNKNILNIVKENIDFIINNVDDKGRIGAVLKGEWWRWPYASINRLLMMEFELTGDKKYLEVLENHYNTFDETGFADDLELANVEELCWLYEKTDNDKYLEIAEKAYELFKSDIKNRDRRDSDLIFGSDRIPDNHGVVYIELLKVPVLLYLSTGKKEYLKEAINGLKKMEKHFMLVSGLPSTTEHFKEKSDTAGHETCNAATLPYTYGMFLCTTGDTEYADKIEKAVFNAGLGSITKDFKSHQYFSSPNQILSTFESNRYGYHHGSHCYLPGHSVECCTGNVNRFMPYFVEQIWLKSNDSGIAVSAYGPSKIKTTVGELKKSIEIIQTTDYPFKDEIVLDIKVDGELNFSLYFRIPSWCNEPELKINGKICKIDWQKREFFKLERTFRNGDKICLRLPMEVKLTKNENNNISVERGPLVYSLAVDQEKKIIKNYPKSNNDFPAIERKASSEWRYAIVDDRPEDIKVEEKDINGYPWDIQDSPISIRVPVKKILDWGIEEFFLKDLNTVVRTTPRIPNSIKTEERIEYLKFVPYGSTELRMTIFPQAKLKRFCCKKYLNVV